MSEDKPKSRRGFASFSKEKLLETSRKGGASVPSDKRAFAKDRGLASEAGRAGARSRAVLKPKGPPSAG